MLCWMLDRLVTERKLTKGDEDGPGEQILGQVAVTREATTKAHEMYATTGSVTARRLYPDGYQPSWKPVQHGKTGYIDDDAALELMA